MHAPIYNHHQHHNQIIIISNFSNISFFDIIYSQVCLCFQRVLYLSFSSTDILTLKAHTYDSSFMFEHSWCSCTEPQRQTPLYRCCYTPH